MNNSPLIDQLSEFDFLHDEAWNRLNKSNPKSFGITSETIKSFGDNVTPKLKSISSLLRKKKYEFLETRASLLPKKEKNDFRPLQIPDVKDRVVLKGLAILIEKEFEPVLKGYKDVSFAYQKGLGIRDALRKIFLNYKDGYVYVLEADLKNFFGTVDKESLLKNMGLSQTER